VAREAHNEGREFAAKQGVALPELYDEFRASGPNQQLAVHLRIMEENTTTNK
jgi:hypothetical protein